MTIALTKLLAFSRAPWNAVAFAARRRLRWERGKPDLRHEDKAGLFDYLDAGAQRDAMAREAALRERYDLRALAAQSTRVDYRENLYLLDVFERLIGLDAASGATPAPLRACDVGAKNWCYAFGLERFLQRWAGDGRDVELRGVEIDGHGVYPDWHSRVDWARAYAAQTGNPQVHYCVADFLDEEVAGLDVVTMLYPFVSRYALVRWGLPVRLYQPGALFTRAVASLRPGGTLVVLNQTERERDRAVELAQSAGALLRSTQCAGSRLVAYHDAARDRCATLFHVPDPGDGGALSSRV